jgi:hypothetical protein
MLELVLRVLAAFDAAMRIAWHAFGIVLVVMLRR